MIFEYDDDMEGHLTMWPSPAEEKVLSLPL